MRQLPTLPRRLLHVANASPTDLSELSVGLAFVALGLHLANPRVHSYATTAALQPVAAMGLHEAWLGAALVGIGLLAWLGVGEAWLRVRLVAVALTTATAAFFAVMFVQGSPCGTGWVWFATLTVTHLHVFARLLALWLERRWPRER